MFKCEFCNTEFKSISSLNYHKKNTQYCLNIQNNNEKDNLNNVEDFICEFCNCKLKSKRNLNYHKINCKQKIINDATKDIIENINQKHQEEISELNLIIATLRAKLEIYERDHNVISDIAKQTKNTYNNHIVNNMAVFDIDKITENFTNKLGYITKEDIINGQKGIASILAPCLYDNGGNKMITCTDKSRLTFTKLDKDNNKIKDQELKNLASVIKPLALKKADEIVEEHTKLKEKLYNIDSIKTEIKDYTNYINNFRNVINDYKIANVKSGLIRDYEEKIQKYQKIIDTPEICAPGIHYFPFTTSLDYIHKYFMNCYIDWEKVASILNIWFLKIVSRKTSINNLLNIINGSRDPITLYLAQKENNIIYNFIKKDI